MIPSFYLTIMLPVSSIDCLAVVPLTRLNYCRMLLQFPVFRVLVVAILVNLADWNYRRLLSFAQPFPGAIRGGHLSDC